MADLAIAIEITGKDSFSGPLGAAQKGLGGFLGGVKDLGIGIFGITQTFDLAKGAIEGLIGPAIDAQQVASQTAAVLKSTGGAAGLTADDISGLAGSLSKLTPFEDEAIQSAENLLLTFTNIGGDVMPAATETVLNMSQALGQDLKSSSVQLGKALNDPIKGITALSRVGVSFTQEQKDQIKVMQEAGDVAGAQAVILGELDKEFGGAAKAAGQTFGGQMVILQTAVGNVAEAIGGPLVKGLSTLATAALPAVQAFADELPAAIDSFMGSLSGLGSMLDPLITILTDGWNTVIQVFQGDWSASDSIDPVVNLIGQLAGGIKQLADIAGPLLDTVGMAAQAALGGDFTAAAQGLLEVVLNIGEQLVPLLQTWANAFLSWIGPMIPPLLQQLLSTVLAVDTWIVQTGLPMLVTQLAVWAGAFVDWVAPLIPPLLVELGTLAVQIGSWMLTVALPAMAANLLQWGVAFVEWVAPRIPLLIGELAKLELALITWTVTDALPAIVGKLVEWGGAFLGWVAKDVLPKLPETLGGILDGISKWITESLNGIAAKAGAIGLALLGGIQKGISDGLVGFRSFIETNVGGAIPQWVKDALGIKSPSTVFYEIGRNITSGLALGIQSGGSQVNDVMQIVINEAIKNGIDPLIALALAKAESSLNPNAIGDNGHSVGLFQLHDQGQGAGQSVAQRQDPRHNAGQFLAAHAALYKQLVAEGLAGDQLAATFGRLAEQSDPQFAQRYAVAYRELAAQFGTTNLAAGTASQGVSMLATTQQQGITWAQEMARQQQVLTDTLSQQAPPLRDTKAAMADFGSVLGPVERQVAGGAISLNTLEFKLIDLARATGLSSDAFSKLDADNGNIDQVFQQVINSAADAGPQFDALRKYLDTAGSSSREAALQFLQLALNYKTAAPAIAATATATGAAADQTGQATDAVSDLTGKYTALSPVIGAASDMVKEFQKSIDAMDPSRIDDIGGAFDHTGQRIKDATDRLRDFIRELENAPSGGSLPGFAAGGTVRRGGPALVGELGPEILNLRAGDRITPNSQLRGLDGGGGNTYIFEAGSIVVPGLVGTVGQVADAIESAFTRKVGSNGRLAFQR